MVPAFTFMEIKMNKRLSAIAALVNEGKGLVDVGTDHGYLPAYLASSGYKGALFASDINEGPLHSARRTAAESGQKERICFLLCDGLSCIRFLLCDGLSLCPPEEIDTIVIAGMGGDMIVKILDEAEWCMDPRYHLILQPMTKAEVLRYWLVYNKFAIESETIVEDGGALYQIISSRFGECTRLTDAELFTGKRALCIDSSLFECQLLRIIARFEKAVAGMQGRGADPRLYLYREILDQLSDMREQK